MSKRNNWTEAEDNLIREAVLLEGQKKWTRIAKLIRDTIGIENRTGKQCRERWHNHLNPDISKDNWTAEEISKIFRLQKQLGNKWSEISSHLPGRTDNSIKNFFYSSLRRNLRSYNREKPETEKLRGSIKKLLKKPYSRKILIKHNETSKKGAEEKTELFKPAVIPLTPTRIFQYPETPSTSLSVTTENTTKSFLDFFDQFPSVSEFLDLDEYSKILESQASLTMQLEVIELVCSQLGYNQYNLV